ncbi:hypothetical protein acsn021_22460 [Anaerocolumna cellulosilytica]|uniref:Uncharacterized protein n=1 Tax=Anaerocolumna cellulosilytica TaxID=433286 RepID=A0A6S6R3R3_9FIRM|nr:WbqC family protein [Anaerocolumna cellulosilytica]MBB5194107.1 hypothetical protein [Anaerocolumna cellulosilytica]BCJ94677.1 hypothetical protein acsn021_22460 [Anaerocolumna cellulosilytica]
MIVTIHQPDYIPYIGYFYKISKADVFVFLDDAQFSNDNMHHWNKIKTPQGELRLKIPVSYHFGDSIHKIRTKDELGWKEKHLKILEMNYKKSRYFNEIFPFFRELLLCNYDSLADMNITINRYICYGLGLVPRFIKASELNIASAKEEKVLDVCTHLDGTDYISGIGAKAYQTEEHFRKRGICLSYTDYKPVLYPQLWGEFIKNLSILDFLFNCGFHWELIEEYLID